ncbi:hypothetical protein BaRGS_00034815 [Batillaria attramentaria]|uniref:Uncharacterized protein n=1 Tax=Batillaria attramentaria TaxID=370345 RepID=A0ABD0JGK3_9CAEN
MTASTWLHKETPPRADVGQAHVTRSISRAVHFRSAAEVDLRTLEQRRPVRCSFDRSWRAVHQVALATTALSPSCRLHRPPERGKRADDRSHRSRALAT